MQTLFTKPNQTSRAGVVADCKQLPSKNDWAMTCIGLVLEMGKRISQYFNDPTTIDN